MELLGNSLIGNETVSGQGRIIRGVNPATGEALLPDYADISLDEMDKACCLAAEAFDPYRQVSRQARATFLECIAEQIEALGSALIERAKLETGLPAPRLEGERARTCAQLRLFASVVRSGGGQDLRIDTALPERSPLPRSDLRMRQIGLGPVAVFGASNFPLAFSVAGGDTASALAAGCPVIVKAHPSHPGTSELVGRAIQQAVVICAMPEGVFSLLFASSNELGQALVTHAKIQAVGFTGSRQGGLALLSAAQARPQPIPVYAEMSSINPVLLLPNALQQHAERLADGFVSSLTLGAGQFCTNPGLILAIKGEALNQFATLVRKKVATTEAQTMLSPAIYNAYRDGLTTLDTVADRLAVGLGSEAPNRCQVVVYRVTASRYMQTPALHAEVFGAVSLIVECDGVDEMQAIIEQAEGQLTLTLHAEEQDHPSVQALLPTLERRAGRLLLNGWPTGVEVCHAMVHGGPYPSTSDLRSTSVGSAAIQRFLRPVCYQDFADSLLPSELQQDNPDMIRRLVNGEWQ
ncbi:aldehyde dehydrogenase (NADP(+)) [Nitrincola sp.]|uniref:aldehyde dehydrogenase (NADP(+)) n=1 Tax=Nitrincola sp. TaxID=1926584 RepID=UPI003A8EA09B